jgi:hypothetical protein
VLPQKGAQLFLLDPKLRSSPTPGRVDAGLVVLPDLDRVGDVAILTGQVGPVLLCAVLSDPSVASQEWCKRLGAQAPG